MKQSIPFAVFALIMVVLIGCLGVRSQSQEQAKAPAVRAVGRVAPAQPANLARLTLKIRDDSDEVMTAFGVLGDGTNGALGTIQPGIAAWNGTTGTALVDRQINVPPSGNFDTATSDAGHDSPEVSRLSNGGVLAVYGAASTYSANHPPQDWACNQGAYCEPFKYAPPGYANASALVERLADSREYLLPSIGLSEASSATLADTTVIAGQQQPNSRSGQGGAPGFVTLHVRQGVPSFDTDAGPWNFQSSKQPLGDGLEMLTRGPNDDAYFDFGITRDSPGSAQIELSVGEVRCSLAVQSTGASSPDAVMIADAIDRRCQRFDARFGAMPVAYDPAMRVDGVALAPAVVGVFSRHENVVTLPLGSEIRLSCSGAVACGSSRGSSLVSDVRLSGLHRHFLWGGVIQSGPYLFYIMDVQQVTGSWFGNGGNSYALALACFRARAPEGASWTWSDCSGRHPFKVVPAGGAPDRLTKSATYFLPPPVHGYANGMLPYITDFSMKAQQVAKKRNAYPVLSAESAVMLRDGTLLVAHGCQTLTETTVCSLVYDTRSGTTLQASTVDRPAAGGSLASVGVRVMRDGTPELAVLSGEGDKWGCGARGVCAILYRYNTRTGGWRRERFRAIGGTENAGFPGTVTATPDGFIASVHILEGQSARLQVSLLP